MGSLNMFFALLYQTVDDYMERRQPLRESHLALVRRESEAGRLWLAGAFNPADGALLVRNVDDVRPIEAFVADDPYVKHGLVRSWQIREWTVVAGSKTKP
jgi:uncharacterized protein